MLGVKKGNDHRGTGRTRAMVMALPMERCIVVVHALETKNYLMRMISDLRGRSVADKVEVIAVRNGSDVQRLRGVQIPVFVDHWVWQVIDGVTAWELSVVAEIANIRRAPA